MWHSGVLDARNTPPFSSLRVLSYRFPSESVLGSIQSGVSGVSGFCVHGSIPGSPSVNSHRDIPSLSITPQVRGSTCQVPPRRVSPISPKIPRHSSPPPIHGVFPPFRSAPPPRRGHNGKLSFSCFFNVAGTRLVPPHSLAFRPECYPRVLHPTQTYRPLPRRCGQGGSAAPRGYPPSGALQHAAHRPQKGQNRAGRPPASNPHSP